MTHAPLRVLLVEDEALIAMDLELTITDAGDGVVGTAASLSDVEGVAPDLSPDLAFVDMHLARGSTGLEVNDLIRDRWPETRVVFLTANPLKVPEDFAGAVGVITKPFTTRSFLAALTWLRAYRGGDLPDMAVPDTLTLAPHLGVPQD